MKNEKENNINIKLNFINIKKRGKEKTKKLEVEQTDQRKMNN